MRALDSAIGFPSRPTSASSMLGLLMPDEVRSSFMRLETGGAGENSPPGSSLVRVPGDKLCDSEGHRDLESGEKAEADDDQYHGVPGHSLCRLALGREPGCLVRPLLGSVEQAVRGLDTVALRFAQRRARSHGDRVPVRAQA